MIGDFLNWCERGGQFFNGQITPGPNYSVWPGGGPGIVFSKSCIVLFLQLMANIKIRYFNHDVWLHYLYLQRWTIENQKNTLSGVSFNTEKIYSKNIL